MKHYPNGDPLAHVNVKTTHDQGRLISTEPIGIVGGPTVAHVEEQRIIVSENYKS